LSVSICFVIGTIELLGILPGDLSNSSHGFWHTSFWNYMANFNINTAGFVIVGMFIVTWAAAILIWRYCHIEERWTARLQGAGGAETRLSPPWSEASE
jgi:high-affinity nickel-transport protein